MGDGAGGVEVEGVEVEAVEVGHAWPGDSEPGDSEVGHAGLAGGVGEVATGGDERPYP